jgi:lipopolysaccharide/colanic/teichoic acid biosynthesis glycosyltransferase
MATNCQSDPVISTIGVSDASPFERPGSTFSRLLKRALDVCGAALFLLLTLPLFPVIAIAILLDSPGPIFFCPLIIGYRGRKFSAYKFRTMQAGAFEALLQNKNLLRQYQQNLKLVNDPRVTRVGRILRRTSLDELPQLLNVLKGEMSLVGPRMLATLELEKFGEHRQKILSVKPGMAGLWVASGRQTLSFEQRVKLELEYVNNWSLWLDARCFFKTVWIALRMVGAH